MPCFVPLRFPKSCLIAAALIFGGWAIAPAAARADDAPASERSDNAAAEQSTEASLGRELHPATVLPLAAPHWWEHNRNKSIIAAALAVPLALYLIVAFGHSGVEALLEKAHEYGSFIVLLGALFVISGGIFVQGSLSGTPLLNTALLGFGAVIANVVGTTGASMLLIRPLLRANEPRRRKTHVIIFFIFVVSNCGGLLTPL